MSPAQPKMKRPQPHSVRSPSSHTQDLPLSGTKSESDDVIVRTGGVGAKVTPERQGGMYGQGPTHILLDVNTADNYLLISDDLRTATWKLKKQNRPETTERFEGYNQVMSSRRLTSGRHYWDVEINRSEKWMVGMCYPSIDRRERQSCIGYNKMSWCLYGKLWCKIQYSVIHCSEVIRLPHKISSDRVRVCLDYEAGRLSFYELCDPIRPCDGCITICGVRNTCEEPSS
ncbi:zinc ion binding [Pristimantis euphronides]